MAPRPQPKPEPQKPDGERVPLPVVDPDPQRAAFPEPPECEIRHRAVTANWRDVAAETARQAVKSDQYLMRSVVIFLVIFVCGTALYDRIVGNRVLEEHTKAINRLADAISRWDQGRTR